MPTVLVLMSTYNGEKYLSEQIRSIFNQRDVEVNILIRDDGSKDNTIQILKNIQLNNPNKIQLIIGENEGYKKSFMELVYQCSKKYDFYAFADQDDVWLNDKLINAIVKLKQYSYVPSLYYGMMTQVDVNLNRLQDQQRFKSVPNYKMILFQNFVQGSTIVFNRELLQLANEYIVKENVPHDVWLPILAKYCGNVVGDTNSYILYRKHNSAVTVNMKKNYLKDLISNIFSQYKLVNYAKLLDNGYYTFINSDYRKFVRHVAEYRKISNKLKLIFDKHVRKYTFKGTVLLKFAILFNRLS